MAREKHIHQYRRAKLGKEYEIYKCAIPGCAHYISSDLIIGKKNVCWRCGDVHFIVRKLAKPHCPKCTKSSEVREESYREIREEIEHKDSHSSNALDDLLKGVIDI